MASGILCLQLYLRNLFYFQIILPAVYITNNVDLEKG